jgi:uncharacterized delta-60 repeat protein
MKKYLLFSFVLLFSATVTAQLLTRYFYENEIFFEGNGAVKIQNGSDAERPSTPFAGMLRFNTTGNEFEGYDGTEWGAIGGGGGVPLLAKGSLLTSDGVSNGEFSACADTEIIEWDAAETSGFKCVAKPVDTDTNAGTLCASGEYLNGDGTCEAIVVDTNTNAGTICTTGELLNGDGTCEAIPVDTDTNAGTICTTGQFLNGDGVCEAIVVDTNTNAGTICTTGQLLNGDGVCEAIPVDTDTNAGTLCASGEYLDGDGTCKVAGGSNSATSINITNNQSTPQGTGVFISDLSTAKGYSIDYFVNRELTSATDGNLDTTFMDNAVSPNKISSIAWDIQEGADGSIMMGGVFQNYAGTAGQSWFLKFSKSGVLDSSFMANGVDGKINNQVMAIGAQSDGKILIGGRFTDYGGTVGRNRLIRLNADGTLDTAFMANAVDGTKFNNEINALRVQSDGKILVGGSFSDYAGTVGRNAFLRLNADGTVDTSFVANATDGAKFNTTVSQLVKSIREQSDGKLLVAGLIDDYGGTVGRDMLLRFNTDGTLDTSFVANAVDGGKFTGLINQVRSDNNGKVLICSGFNDYAGTVGRSKFLRLNTDGTLDTAFVANATDGAKFNNQVTGCDVQPDDKIILSGYFTDYAGTVGRSRVIRLNDDGTLDAPYSVIVSDGSKFSSNILSSLLDSDGSHYVAGVFTNYSGVTGYNRLAKFINAGVVVDEKISTGKIYGTARQGAITINQALNEVPVASGVTLDIDSNTGEVKWSTDNQLCSLASCTQGNYVLNFKVNEI